MATETVKKVNEDTTEFVGYIQKLQKLHDDYYAKMYNNLTPPSIEFNVGSKFIKVIRQERHGNILAGQSVQSFVNRETGDIMKPATWRAPAKHARGNIFSAQNGMEAVSENGFVHYLV